MTSKQKLLLIVGGFLVLALVVAALLLGKSGTGVQVQVQALPADSAITLDGKPIKAGHVQLSPGTHVFEATRQYFDPVTKTVDTKGLNKSRVIYLMPIPNSSAAMNYLLNHPAVQQQREAAAGADAAQTSQNLTATYPIIGYLPYQTTDFKVDYSLDSKNTLSLLVTVYPIADPTTDRTDYTQQYNGYKAEALQFIQSNKVNITTTQITYTASSDPND
ncbi:MAG TPA: hypothetical protein VLH84_06160 [Patescibacteria group bacterium]|nr:hypothetical protein [Patescibacteria group bacterium]